MIVLEDLEIEKKLEILSDAAKYDVACTSSGVERKGSQEGMGNATRCGICHSFAADGRCISLLKVLMTNECIYDCKYCINRIVYAAGALRADDPVLSAQLYRGALFELGDQAFAG